MKPTFQIKQDIFELIYQKFDTQSNLAQEIQIDPSYLSKILLGKQKISLRVAYTIAESLETDIDNCFKIS